jgi:membrane-associated phospholipid phosphatase
VSRPGLAAAAIAVAFAALAATVAAGGLTWLDQYAVDHWMPELRPHDRPALVSVSQLYPHLRNPVEAVCALWTYPASGIVSGLILVACCVVLDRRGRRSAAVAWAVGWVLANAVEVLGKTALGRPELTADGGRVAVFASSFPSGHATRAVLTAALVAAVLPRFAVPVVVWAAAVLPALVILGNHTPSDVLAGALLGVLTALAVDAWLRANVAGERVRPRPFGLRSAVAEDR